MSIHVLYHDDADGYASALAAYLKFGEFAKYISVQYGQGFPMETISSNADIYILDFSYAREILDEVSLQVNSLTVIDHHETARDQLADLPYAIFDMEKSGATMSWEFFHPEKEVPYLFRLVEDHDLWKFELEHTRAFDLGMATSGKYSNIQFWYQVFMNPIMLHDVIQRGQPLVDQQDARIRSFFKKKHYRIIDIDGHQVAVYNLTGNTFEISHFATEAIKQLDVDYTISYFFTSAGEMALSYRSSRKSNIHVGHLCRKQGGGGHRNAAGAKLTMEQSYEFLKKVYGE